MIIDTTVGSLASMAIPFSLLVIAILLVLWLFLKWIASLDFIQRKFKNKNKDSLEDEVNQREESVLPNWLRNRKEMIFSESSIIKGQQLGKGQFGIVMKGVIIQGNARYVEILIHI